MTFWGHPLLKQFSISKFLRPICALLLILPLLLSGQSALASIPDNTAAASPGDIGWRSGFYLNGVNGYSSAIAVDGSHVYVGGNFTVAGDTPANRVAMWDGAAWHALGSGMDKPVYALAVDGRGHLYAGGIFTTAGGIPANGIARWNGQAWEALGNGVSDKGVVLSIVVDSASNIYAAGIFNTAGDIQVHGLARWDGAAWHSVGEFNPTEGWVRALTIDRFGFIYAGGNFTFASGSPANYLARWDGAQWSALGAGIDGESPFTMVSTLASDSRGNLFVGGRFTSAGGASSLNLARWNGESWLAVGIGAEFTESVWTILADGGNLYVRGEMAALPGGKPQTRVAKWDGSTWEDLNGDVSAAVTGFAMDRDGNLFAAGSFSSLEGVSPNGIAKWDGSNWTGLGADQSASNTINAILSDRHEGVYVGGSFLSAGGLTVNGIAHWDGTSWSGLGDGLADSTDGVQVTALAMDKEGNIYAGGRFTQAGGTAANNVARWSGDRWEALGEGANGFVRALAFDSEDHLYVGGSFDHAGNIAANNVAKWTGSTWEALGSGIDESVSSLAVDDEDRLFAGGYFSFAGGIEAHGLARWNGSTWESFSPRYFDPTVLLFSHGTLYIGGASILAMRDGEFQLVGGGFGFSNHIPKQYAIDMTADAQGNLIVGGNFDKVGDTQANYIARWNGSYWENLGSGLDNVVSALAVGSDGQVFVGGIFSLAGGKVSDYFAQWDEPFYQWLPVAGK